MNEDELVIQDSEGRVVHLTERTELIDLVRAVTEYTRLLDIKHDGDVA